MPKVEMLGAASAEYACLIANPTLVVEGDATSAGLSTNMEKRVSMLEEVVADLAAYYPDLKQLGETIAPLKEKLLLSRALVLLMPRSWGSAMLC